MRLPQTALYAGLCGVAALLLACEPPGKPPAHPQTENRKDITDFKVLYSDNCSGCHGDNGQKGPARILNDKLYLSILPKETLKQIITNGRPGTAMPAWAESRGGPLTDKQVDVLVNGIYANWGGAAAPPGAPAYAEARAGDPSRGKALFVRSCFMCHGQGAAVGPVTKPNYLQLVSNQVLRTSIIVGRPDLGMPSYQHLNLGKALTDSDVSDLVAYLDSQRTTPAPGVGNMPGGQQTSPTGPHEVESGSGQNGNRVKGNEGSGNGPGSPTQTQHEGNKGKGSSSQRGVK